MTGDLPHANFSGRTFDVITYIGVLEHVPDPFAHVVRCKSLLDPGGKLLLLGLPNLGSAGFSIAKERWIGLDAPRHVHQFTKQSFAALLTKAGFTIERLSVRSARFNPPSLVASMFPALHRHKFAAYEARTGKNPIIRKATLFGMLQLVRPVDWALCQFGLGEHLSCVAVPGNSR